MSDRPQLLSEAELRGLSHDQLLAYTLQHAQIRKNPSQAPAKRAAPEPDIQQSSQPVPRKRKKRRKEFDMARYGQRLVALRLAYAGWKFHGFSSQADSENTVEHHLFTALTRTRLIESRETCNYSRSGRTDVGVSALGQVIGIRLRSSVVPPSSADKELDFVKVINGNLPEGIRVLSWAPVPDGSTPIPKTYEGDPEPIRQYWKAVENGIVAADSSAVRRPGEAFSARFDAIYRSYKYFFVRGTLDLTAMQKAARFFEGTHDFRNFCRIDENITNFERRMYAVDIYSTADDKPVRESTAGDGDEYAMYYIFVKGQAFLWHQVRCMAAVLFDVGMRCEEPLIVKSMLEDVKYRKGPFANGKPHYRMASPTPLLLYECAYPASVVGFTQSLHRESQELPFDQQECLQSKLIARTGFEKADASLALLFSESANKTAILRSMLQENKNVACAPVGSGHNFGDEAAASLNAFQPKRNFLPHLFAGKHVPYSLRPCDDSVETKQARAAKKNKSKTLSL